MPEEPVKLGNIVTLLGPYVEYESKDDKAEATMRAIQVVEDHGRVAVDGTQGIKAAQVGDYIANSGNGLTVVDKQTFEEYWITDEKETSNDVEKQTGDTEAPETV